MARKVRSEYGISRIDNENSRTHGWLVTIQRRGVIYRRHFSDGPHGGKLKALAAARAYRDEIVDKHPPMPLKEYTAIVKRNNKSGVVGVSKSCSTATQNLPPEEQRWFWVAAWPLPNGRRKRVKFSANKYGDEGAFQLAVQAREEAMAKMTGYFDPGATRRPRRRKPRAVEATQQDSANDSGFSLAGEGEGHALAAAGH